MLARFGCASISRRNACLIFESDKVWEWLEDDEDWLHQHQLATAQRVTARAPPDRIPILSARVADLLSPNGLRDLRALARHHAGSSLMDANTR